MAAVAFCTNEAVTVRWRQSRVVPRYNSVTAFSLVGECGFFVFWQKFCRVALLFDVKINIREGDANDSRAEKK